MALHPRLSRPSLELPPRRPSHGMLIGVVLAVMGTGFALAMPIAMKTWSDAADRTEAVARVNAAKVPVDEFADPFELQDPVAQPSSPRRLEPQKDDRMVAGEAPKAPLDERPALTPVRDPQARSVPERQPEEPESDDASPEPAPQDGKRDEDVEEMEPPPEPDDDDGTGTGATASGRAIGRDEDEGSGDEPEDEDDGSGSGSERGGGPTHGRSKGTNH